MMLSITILTHRLHLIIILDATAILLHDSRIQNRLVLDGNLFKDLQLILVVSRHFEKRADDFNDKAVSSSLLD
jgi:hypothetical protein